MRPIVFAAVSTALLCAACTNSVSVQREAEVFNSIPFDEVPCAELRQRRNRLAAQHGVPPDAERQPQSESQSAGFGIVIPDARSSEEKARAMAVGEITAMNDSLRRRKCGQAG